MRRRTLACFASIVLASCALGASIGACSSSSSDPGGGPTPPVDTGVPAVDSGRTIAELTVLSADKLDVPADLSCMGAPDAGPPPPLDSGPGGDAAGDGAVVDGGPAPYGTLIDVSFKLTEFGGGGSDIVVGANVDFFYKNTLGAGEADLKQVKTDDKGRVAIKLPAGAPFAFEVSPNDLLRTFVQFDEIAPVHAGDTYEGSAITKSKYDQFALAITGKTGFLTAPGTGIVAGRVRDCQKRNIRNAVLTLIDQDTAKALPTGTGDADMRPVHYLTDQELPSNGYTFTSRSGLFAVINVPKTTGTTHHFRAVATGLFGSSTELRPFAYRDLEVTEAAVNSQYVDPK